MNDADGPRHEVLARGPKWAVYKCANGCMHVRLQNVTLTFSPDEFAQLVEMMGDAYVRLGVRAAVATLGPH